MKKIAEEIVIKVKPAGLEFTLKEIPSGVSFSHQKQLRSEKFLETPRDQMHTKSHSRGRMSQLAFVTKLEVDLNSTLFNYKLYKGDGHMQTRWNKTAEWVREDLYRYKLKNNKIKTKISDLKVIITPCSNTKKEMRFD
tara:strand:+ start:964 stop:1377 length:414 start_codon:yes stop_codon:yes gene_type:complete